MAGKRWRPRGMSKRRGTANEYIWRYVPEDIWRERDKLVALGVTKLDRKSQQWRQSLGTADRDEAAGKERRLRDDWARKEAEWRRLLRDGPVSLTQADAIELAAIGALEFFNAHISDPLEIPGLAVPHASTFKASEKTRAILAAMSEEDRQAAYAEGQQSAELLVSGTPVEKLKVLRDVREGRGYPWSFPEFREIGLRMAEAQRGSATDADLALAGIAAVDEGSRFQLNHEGMAAVSKARSSLEARALGDLGTPQWVSDAERVTPS